MPVNLGQVFSKQPRIDFIIEVKKVEQAVEQFLFSRRLYSRSVIHQKELPAKTPAWVHRESALSG
ncbi:hypothetical protein Enr17x_53820 [Gimesia fumaroli]|uniref:Uncharacterized protein n=1 Tax=Gimesia fumaroli TaxID=2527976 RepID=A0A518IJP2_9PLAN|nr:hypothetical protein Enr17x_53820 [Gimesia fumaroli]